MIWETIKNKAIDDLLTRLRDTTDPEVLKFLGAESIRKMIEKNKLVQLRDLKQEWEPVVQEAVNRCDIRAYKDLMKIAPKAFPAYARNGRCRIALTEKGWEIINVEHETL